MAGITETARRLFYIWTTPRREGLTVPNFCIVSDPGEGKTMIIEAVAKALGVTKERSIRWSVGQHDPMDFNGWGVPREDGLTFEAPARIRRLIKSPEPGLLFLDEANQATPTQQGALLKLMDARAVGDEDPLGPHILMGMAMNPPETGAASQDTTRPFSNRVCWLPYDGPSRAEHAAFMIHRGSVPIELPAQQPRAELDRCYAMLTAVYERYMSGRGHLREDPLADYVVARFASIEVDGVRQYIPAFARPRTWDMALQLASTALAYGDRDAMTDFLIGCVGPQEGRDFDTFYAEQDLIDPEVLLADPDKWTPDGKRPDRTFAQMLAVAMHACDARDEKVPGKKWHAAWSVLRRTMDAGEGKDMVAPAAAHLALHVPHGGVLRAHIDTIRQLTPVIVAGNVKEDGQ